MTGTTTEASPGGTSTTTTTPAWFSTFEPETIGHIQNKGWDKLEPAAAAGEAVKAHRAAEAKLGIPADRVLRRPTEGNVDETKAFWQSVGAPADPKEYAFEGVDFGDEALTGKFNDAMRAAAAEKFVPKDLAAHMAAAAFKFIADQGKAEDAATTTAKADERAKLEQDWGSPDGAKFIANMGIADRTAAALGITPEQWSALAGVVGGAQVIRMFRSLGDKLGEAKYVVDPNNPANGVMTREQAIARRFDLTGINGQGQTTGKGDKAWTAKLHAGDVQAKKEWADLLRIIASA